MRSNPFNSASAFRMLSLVPLSAILTLGATGCSSDSTNGERDLVEFSYTAGCLLSCDVERPLMTGTHETISVSDPGNVAGASARSSDDAVARFALERRCSCVRSGADGYTESMSIAADESCGADWRKECYNIIQMTALAAGDVVLDLLDAEGDLIDRVGLRVREPASATFEAYVNEQFRPATSLTVGSGERMSLHVILLDADGYQLIANDSVTWTSDDAAIAGIAETFGEAMATLTDDDGVWVVALTSGTTTLRERARDLEGAITVAVQ